MLVDKFTQQYSAAIAKLWRKTTELVAGVGLRDRLRQDAPADIELGELSMGMSGDYEIAIEEGATVVRVGQAIFGARPMPDSYYWPSAEGSEAKAGEAP